MNLRSAVLLISFTVVGCGGANAGGGNKVLTPPAEDKSAAESALRAHGIEGAVIALQNRGDYWTATVAAEAAPSSDGSGKMSLAPPAIYHVYRDGRVVDPQNGKSLRKK